MLLYGLRKAMHQFHRVYQITEHNDDGTIWGRLADTTIAIGYINTTTHSLPKLYLLWLHVPSLMVNQSQGAIYTHHDFIRGRGKNPNKPIQLQLKYRLSVQIKSEELQPPN